MSDFRDILTERILVCDGAMGTLLYEKGISFDHSFDEINLSNPGLVTSVHEAYLEAGADIIETNTFGGSRFRLIHHGLEEKVADVNSAGAALAREAARACSRRSGRDIFVAGSVGPLGKPLEPIGKIKHEEAFRYFAEQIAALESGGVDVIMIETMSDIEEARQAVLAARSVSRLPVVVQMSFTEDGKTLMGHKPAEVARVLAELGADVVGANCSVGPQGLLDVLERMTGFPGIRLSVQPNAGLPRYVGGRYIYLASPDYFGEYARLFAAAGAHIIGGCCGTTPDHIRAIRKSVGTQAPKTVRAKAVTVEPEETVARSEPRPVASSLIEKFAAKKFVISIELDPPRGLHYEKVIEGAVLCKKHDVDAINIADNPLAKAGMTPLAMASLIRQSVNIETILHFSCRDRNLLAMQSELMSAHVLNIRTILSVTGDPPIVGDYPDATGVFDVDAIGLLNLIHNLNQGIDLAGKSVGARTNFFRACAANPTPVDWDRELDRFEQKIAAGAEFAMTQVMYDLRPLEHFMKRFQGRIPVVLGLMPLKNAKHASFMHYEIPDISIPDAVQRRMEKAGERGQQEGIRIAQEYLREARSMIDGVYIMPPFNRFEMAFEVLQVL